MERDGSLRRGLPAGGALAGRGVDLAYPLAPTSSRCRVRRIDQASRDIAARLEEEIRRLRAGIGR